MFGIRSSLGMSVEVKTPRQHYKGEIKSELFKSNSYDVKITEVIKGKKKVGNYIKVPYNQVEFL